MKRFFSLNTILLALAAIFVTASVSFAASDYLLEIKGVEGESKGFSKRITCSGGVCTIEGLKVGKYSVTVCDKDGKALPATGQVTVECINSPRDAASGLPTGKRMHKPFTITKELDKSSPTLYITVAAGDVDGDGMFDATFKTGHVTLIKQRTQSAQD